MPRETVYMLQTFDVKGLTFSFDYPILYSKSDEAVREAQAATRAGVIVHKITGDPVRLIFDQPVVVYAAGALPVGLVEGKAAPPDLVDDPIPAVAAPRAISKPAPASRVPAFQPAMA